MARKTDGTAAQNGTKHNKFVHKISGELSCPLFGRLKIIVN
jgi:hypothetical protein